MNHRELHIITEAVSLVIAQHLAKALIGINGRIATLESRAPEKGEPGRDGIDGKSIDGDDLEGRIQTAIERAVAGLAPPRDGQDGKDGADGAAGPAGAPGERGEPGSDGKDADPEFVRTLVSETVASLPPAAAGMDGANGADGEPGPAGAPGADGKNADPELIRAMVAESVAALPPAPAGKDGRDGSDGKDGEAGIAGPPGEAGADGRDGVDGKNGEAGPAGADGERGADGKDADPEFIRATVSEAVAALPTPRDGADGKDADPELMTALIATEVERKMAALPPPQDGRTPTEDDIRPLVVSEVAKAVSAFPVPKDGKDGAAATGALIDREGHLVLTLSDGSVHALGRVVGRDVDMAEVIAHIEAAVAKFPVPKDGKDGYGFEDLTVEKTGDRSVTIRFVQGDRMKEFTLPLNGLMIYRGVFRDGQQYEHGDVTTWAGSTWYATADTAERPGEGNTAWVLVTKKGRDGKDGTPGKPGERGPEGKNGMPGRDRV